jgi:hypothetical protein
MLYEERFTLLEPSAAMTGYHQSRSHPNYEAFSSDATLMRTTPGVLRTLTPLIHKHTPSYALGPMPSLSQVYQALFLPHITRLNVTRRQNAPKSEEIRNADGYVARTYEL